MKTIQPDNMVLSFDMDSANQHLKRLPRLLASFLAVAVFMIFFILRVSSVCAAVLPTINITTYGRAAYNPL